MGLKWPRAVNEKAKNWIFLGLGLMCLLPSLLFIKDTYSQRNFVMRQDITDVWRAGPSERIQESMGAYHYISRREMISDLSGPMNDSLRYLLGIKDARIEIAGGALSYAGGYDVQKDAILLSPRAGDKLEWRMVWVHELVHALQARQGFWLGKAWQKIGEPDKQVYAARGVQEHQAEAVALAILWLQASRNDELPRNVLMNSLDAVEQKVPGTKLMVQWWLTHPLYRAHPFKVQPEPGLVLISPGWSWQDFKIGETPDRSKRVFNVIATQEGLTPWLVRGGMWAKHEWEALP